MNNIAEIKSNLHQYIANTDDVRLLAKLQQYISNILDQENQTIAYTSEGKKLNQKAYKHAIDRTIEAADSGAIISQKDMEKGL